MTAGARSTFLLPKVSEQTGYKSLRQYFGKQFDKPKNLTEHWHLFKNIFDAEKNVEWNTECLYFSKNWIDLLHDPAWIKVRLYFLQRAWDTSEFFRNQFIWDLAFSLIQQKRCLKIDPYIADTIRHLLFMSTGSISGMGPATSEYALPTAFLQDVFSNIYNLKYNPTIMQPKRLNAFEDYQPIYYSLAYPALFAFSPKNRALSSKISDLYDVKLLFEKYLDEINNVNIQKTELTESLEKTDFHFYHSKTENHYKGINSSDDASNIDPNLAVNLIAMEAEPVAVNSPFMRGCIQLSRHNSN
jgi:hypothetical protein